MSKRRKGLLLMLVLLLAALPLSGCYDRVELEGMAYVVSLGMDQGPGNTIDVTVRIAVPGDVASGQAGGDGGGLKIGGTKPITVRAHTLSEALSLLNGSVERRVSLMHLATIYVGEALAREGIVKYVRPMTRMREFRRTVRIFIVPGSARETFVLNEPVLEKSITRWQESLVEVGRHTGYTAIQSIHDFVTAMESKTEDPIAPVIAVNRLAKEHGGTSKQKAEAGAISEKDAGSFKDITKRSDIVYKPGQVIRVGGNNLEIMGTAIFHDDKLVTYLDGIETRMLLAIRGELTRTQMAFPDAVEKNVYVTVELKHARGPHVEVDLDATPMRVTVKEQLEGNLLAAQGTTDYSQVENINMLERHIRSRLVNIQKELIEEMFHKYQSDPFGILKQTRPRFATSQELAQYDFHKKMKDAVISMDINLQLRRIGTQLAPVMPE